MKRIILICSIFVLCLKLYGQHTPDYDSWYYFTFDDTTHYHRIIIDTVTNHNNVWQIGKPNKTVFDSAYMSKNAILTDTTSTYPINDTSTFTIIHIAATQPYIGVVFGFENMLDSDTLKDFGEFYISFDKGLTWIDIINDTVYTPQVYWYPDKPILTGKTNGWQNYTVQIGALYSNLNIQPFDTVLFRFTFISDSIDNHKDGWMIDNIYVAEWWEGIQEIRNDNLISISPNPVSEKLSIQSTENSDNQTIQIFDNNGKIVLNNQNFKGKTIDTRQFRNGIYFLKYSNANSFSIRKFIVIH